MTPAILILTDDPDRSRRLARDLEGCGSFGVRDIFDGSTAVEGSLPQAVVSDVDLARTDTLLPLRRYLSAARKGGAPLLCLLRTDSSRGRIQASALGASQVVALGATLAPVETALASLVGLEPPARQRAAMRIRRAGAAVSQLFMQDEAPRPEAAIAGTALVLESLQEVGIRSWLDLVWRFDNQTHQHCMLVAGLAGAFGRSLGFGGTDCQRLTQAALLHDLGKARIPKAILNKPGRLDEEETRVMRTHPVIGYEMLVGQGYPDEMLAVVRSHHEMLDGSGYPDGLSAEQIPDLVRLVTICDIYAALIERRPYKNPLGSEEAFAILAGMTGKLDRAMLEAFRPVSVAAA